MSPSYLLWPVSPSSVEERRIGVIIFVEDLLHNVIFYPLSIRLYFPLHYPYDGTCPSMSTTVWTCCGSTVCPFLKERSLPHQNRPKRSLRGLVSSSHFSCMCCLQFGNYMCVYKCIRCVGVAMLIIATRDITII